MRPSLLSLAREFLVAFAVIFVVFTLVRYFGWFGFTLTRGDVAASMRAEVGASLIWSLALVAVRRLRQR